MAVPLFRHSSNVTYAGDAPALPPEQRFPLVCTPASAGFPSPAGDYLEESLDLNEYLVRNRPATFFIRFSGDSLEGIGICSGDLGGCDRSVTPTVGKVVIATVDGEIVAKVFEYIDGRPALVARNDRINYPPIYLDQCQDYMLWGCVTSLVRRM